MAIYLGNDLFLHAPRRGDVVKVSQLSQYYKEVWGRVRWTEVSGSASPSGVEIEVEAGGRPSARVFTVVSGS